MGAVIDEHFIEAAAGIPVSPGSHDFFLTCLTAACVADFSNGHPGPDSLGFLLPETPIPEPPTAVLLGAALLAGIVIRGKRFLRIV